MSRGTAPLPARALTAALAALGLAASACGSELEVDVQLVTKSCGGAALDPMADATQLTVTVYGPGVDSIASQAKVSRSDGAAAIAAIPPGKDRRIVVEAFKESGGDPVARGETGLLDLSQAQDPITVAVFMRRVDGFTPASAQESPSTCSELVRARAGHTATLLEDGRVLIAGGYTDDGSTRLYEQSTEIYDPRTGLFASGPDMALSRAFHTATHVPGTGITVLAGGQFGAANTTGGAIRVGEIFDESARRFRQYPMVEARTHATAAISTRGGKVVILGGYDSRGVALKTSEVWDAGKNAFAPGPTLPAERAEATAVPLASGDIFLLGGFGGLSPIGRAELLHPLTTGNYELDTTLSVALREPRIAPLAAAIDADRVVVAGGFSDHRSDPYGSASAAMETISAATSTDKSGALKNRRGDGGAVSLPDGTVLVGGGAWSDPSGKLTVLADAEIVTRAQDGTLSGRATTLGLRDGRFGATWTLLGDGTVLVTGGMTIDKATGKRVYLRSAEIFQPRYVGSKLSPYR